MSEEKSTPEWLKPRTPKWLKTPPPDGKWRVRRRLLALALVLWVVGSLTGYVWQGRLAAGLLVGLVAGLSFRKRRKRKKRPGGFPAVVPHPAGLLKGRSDLIPLGVTQAGQVVSWDLKAEPHLLVGGKTRIGKSVCLRSIMYEASSRGIEIHVIDPKGSLVGLHALPGVVEIVTTREGREELIHRLWKLMDERVQVLTTARKRGEGRAALEALHPVMLVIDEFAGFVAETESKAMLSELREIVRKGGEEKLTVVIGMQRPDVQLGLPGEMRDNLLTRVGIGKLETDGRVMLGLPRVAPDVKGRAVVNANGTVSDAQLYWTPDPGEWDGLSRADRKLLNRLSGGGPPTVTGVTEEDETAGQGVTGGVPETVTEPAGVTRCEECRRMPSTAWVHHGCRCARAQAWHDAQGARAGKADRSPDGPGPLAGIVPLRRP